MSFLQDLTGSSDQKERNIAIIGPPKAGKTTFVRYLETGKMVDKSPHSTLGIDIRSNYINVHGWQLKVIDTGGEEKYQQTFWEMAIQMANALIFLFDGTMHQDEEYFELALAQFAYALDIIPEGMPLLIAVNKQDLEEMKPLSVADTEKIFEKMNMKGINSKFITTSAKFGYGVKEAIEWLLENTLQ